MPTSNFPPTSIFSPDLTGINSDLNRQWSPSCPLNIPALKQVNNLLITHYRHDLSVITFVFWFCGGGEKRESSVLWDSVSGCAEVWSSKMSFRVRKLILGGERESNKKRKDITFIRMDWWLRVSERTQAILRTIWVKKYKWVWMGQLHLWFTGGRNVKTHKMRVAP